MSDKGQTTDRDSRGFSLGLAITVPAMIKTICGAVVTVLLTMVWLQLDYMGERQKVIDDWEGVQDYAVFYPHGIGNDREEFETGGHGTKIAEARDLYRAADQAGAIFIEASNYEPGVQIPLDSPWPVAPIRVNNNYLEQYPILDESGEPIEVTDEERAWVVAVPEEFKPLEADIQALYEAARNGGTEFQNVAEIQEQVLGEPAPDYFEDQEVRIIWTASGQDVFSFNSEVNPDDGNTIPDPIVEIMTPDNSLTWDRMDAISGDMNTALKIRVDGDPAAVHSELTPLLKELRLDDNLEHLVTPQQALRTELADLQKAITWASTIACVALLVMLVLSAAMVAIGSDRLSRKTTVRRLQGVGFLRTHRELLRTLGATWLGQAVLAIIAAELLISQTAELMAVLTASFAVDVLFFLAAAAIIERRSAVKRLKEL